jgi:hypothetical protein
MLTTGEGQDRIERLETRLRNQMEWNEQRVARAHRVAARGVFVQWERFSVADKPVQRDVP